MLLASSHEFKHAFFILVPVFKLGCVLVNFLWVMEQFVQNRGKICLFEALYKPQFLYVAEETRLHRTRILGARKKEY